jgi:hypothetical protein
MRGKKRMEALVVFFQLQIAELGGTQCGWRLGAVQIRIGDFQFGSLVLPVLERRVPATVPACTHVSIRLLSLSKAVAGPWSRRCGEIEIGCVLCGFARVELVAEQIEH